MWLKHEEFILGNRNCHRTSQEKLEIIKYAEKHGMNKACKKYNLVERTIWRYKSLYDGTLKSLENKSCRPKKPHPREHSLEEVNNIREILSENPYISHKELYDTLKKKYGYKRHIATLYNYLRRHKMIPEPQQKNEYATMFNNEAVIRLNNKFLFDNKDLLPLYVIELSDLGIYIASNVSNYPCKLCVYYSIALTFKEISEAEQFIKSIKNTSKFTLNIRELNKLP